MARVNGPLGLKTYLHGTIETAIYLSQLIGSMGLSVIVAIAPCEHLY